MLVKAVRDFEPWGLGACELMVASRQFDVAINCTQCDVQHVLLRLEVDQDL